MSIPLRMLVVQEKEDDALLIVNELRRSGYDPEFEQVRTAQAFSAALSEGTWDVIIADYTMPRFDGITALNLLQESERDVPFIVVSGKPSEDEAVAAMKAGAHGYIMRRSLARLGQVVRRELQEAQTRRDRRRAREELRKSEEKYRTLVEQSLQGLIIVQNSRIVFANPAFAEISGYTVDELLSLSPEEVRDLVHREDQPLVWGRLSERLEGEPVPPRYEYRGIRKDGSVRWLEMFADRIEYMGKPAVQGAFMDVTERKWAEERLRFLSSIVEQSTEGVAVADLEGNLIFVNNAFASMHGYTPEELVGKPIAVFHTPEQMRDVETANRQIRETGQFSGEIWHVRRDGTVFPTLMHNSLLRDGVGNPIGLIGTMRNIAERKQAEEALRQYTERLKVLREIDQAILEAQSPQEIAQAALARIRQLLPCDRASVMLFDLKAGEGKMLAVNVSGETRIGPEAHLPLAKFGDIEELREGEARLVRDILAVSQPAPLKQTLHAEERLRSFIEVPLISRGELIGSLNLGAEEPDVCGEEQIEVAREVADQLAVAIQNAQLLEVERRHRAELEALHQASLRLTSTLELQPVLETILEQALYPMSADDAHIFLYDGQRLTFGAALWAEGLQKEPYAEPRLDGLTYTVARRGERVVIPDVDVHPLFQDWGWGGAIVGLPLRVGDKVVGVMNVAFKEPHVFSEDELRILRLLADQAAIAIENARLYEEAKQRAAEMFALHETVLDVTAQLEMPSLLDAIIARASELLGATGGLVHLYNPTSGELVAVTSHNLETDYAGLTLGVGEGAAGSVLETGEPAIVEDHRVWSGKSPQVTKADARSVLAVPLKWREQILGVLDIVDNVRVGAFDEQDLRVLVPFANQAAIAIENARLYQETRRQANKLAALIEIGHDISATLDLPTVLERIATHARDLLEADESEVYLLEPDGETLRAIVALGDYANQIKAQPLRLGEGIVGAVAESGVAEIVNRATEDPRAVQIPETPQETHALICAPLMSKGEVVGVMSLARGPGEHKPFDQADLDFMVGLARQASIAIENAQLFAAEHRRAAELTRALEQQRELDRLKDEFMQNVSHELRSPLALILGHAEMLNMGELGELRPQQRKSVSVIARRSRMLSNLVQDITRLLEVGANPPEPEPVSMDELARVAIEDFQMAAEQAGLTLRAHIAPGLAPVSGSSTYFRRVLDNLLNNAIKFTPPQGTVTARVWQEGKEVILQVSDTGIGISDDQLGRVFERFYQVDGSAQRRYGGVGLGLALVREIAELYGGRVLVESQVGVGSAFTVVLPVCEQKGEESSTVQLSGGEES